MKRRNERENFYKWELARLAADRLAIWAYASLLNPQSPQAKEYPLETARCSPILYDGTTGIILNNRSKTRRKKEIPESVRLGRELKAMSNALRQAAKLANSYYSPNFVATELAKSIGKANKLLAELAALHCNKAAEMLWFHTLEGVVELLNLSYREDTLPLLQAVAEKQSMWPVICPRNRAEQQELAKSMKRLRLGVHAFEKVESPNRKNQRVSGDYAYRLGWMLWHVHFDAKLRRCLCRSEVVPAPKPDEKRFRFLGQRTPDADSPEQWEKRLVAQGWPRWAVRLHQLPELTADCAEDWFDVGWEALKEATGGDVTLIPELATLGKSNAAVGRRRVTSERRKTSKQTSRMTEQIKALLEKAFLRRFGNARNLMTNRDLKNH